MDKDFFADALTSELEAFNVNQLNDLGNRAMRLGLIAGHGYHQGQYEILSQGEAILLSPTEAQAYLENLLAQAEG